MGGGDGEGTVGDKSGGGVDNADGRGAVGDVVVRVAWGMHWVTARVVTPKVRVLWVVYLVVVSLVVAVVGVGGAGDAAGGGGVADGGGCCR